MFFKNLTVYRLPAHWSMTADQIEEALQAHTFAPCESLESMSVGWTLPVPAMDDRLVYRQDGQMLISLAIQKKLLPASVVAQAVRERAAEVEHQQGFKPGRRQMKEIKEGVIDELLPRAFAPIVCVSAWIDPVHGWLVIDTGSVGRADTMLKLLFKSIDKLPLESVHVAQAPASAMTQWCLDDEVPRNFTVDQAAELEARTEGKPAVVYKRHTLEADDLRRHIEAGKQVKKLAMTWADRISFVMTESLTIKKVVPLDVLKEQANSGNAENDFDRFQSDFALMTGELNKMLGDLLLAFGGEAPREAQAA